MYSCLNTFVLLDAAFQLKCGSLWQYRTFASRCFCISSFLLSRLPSSDHRKSFEFILLQTRTWLIFGPVFFHSPLNHWRMWHLLALASFLWKPITLFRAQLLSLMISHCIQSWREITFCLVRKCYIQHAQKGVWWYSSFHSSVFSLTFRFLWFYPDKFLKLLYQSEIKRGYRGKKHSAT